jgi:hypothetical protein
LGTEINIVLTEQLVMVWSLHTAAILLSMSAHLLIKHKLLVSELQQVKLGSIIPNSPSGSAFFIRLADFHVKVISVTSGRPLLSSDVNCHQICKAPLDVLDTFGLRQHVTEPTIGNQIAESIKVAVTEYFKSQVKPTSSGTSMEADGNTIDARTTPLAAYQTSSSYSPCVTTAKIG